MRRRLGFLAVLLLLTACSDPAPTDEDAALRSCSDELQRRLDLPESEPAAQTQLIGRRDVGWLVRGLSSGAAATGAQNYECRLDDAGSGPPTLTYLRLCQAGESPWGCP